VNALDPDVAEALLRELPRDACRLVVESFCSDVVTLTERIEAAAAIDDHASRSEAAHALAGAAAAVGALRLEQAARAILVPNPVAAGMVAAVRREGEDAMQGWRELLGDDTGDRPSGHQ
jgi:hypothetical protein